MKVVSIDVGVRNLGVCVLEYTLPPKVKKIRKTKKTKEIINLGIEEKPNLAIEERPNFPNYKIVFWTVLDLTTDKIVENGGGEQINCQGVFKSGKKKGTICPKPSVITINNVGYCKIHCPDKEQLKSIVKAPKQKVMAIPLQTLCVRLFQQLDAVNQHVLDSEEIVIELQPTFNPRMKTLSSMIYSHFIRNGIMNTDSKIKHLRFINAKNKLTVYTGPPIECNLKNQYTRNKFYSKEYCKYILPNSGNADYLEFFNSHKKKDDLSDCFLQGVWYIVRPDKIKIVGENGGDDIILDEPEGVPAENGLGLEKREGGAVPVGGEVVKKKFWRRGARRFYKKKVV